MPVHLDVIVSIFFSTLAYNFGIDEFMVFSTIINVSLFEEKSPFSEDKISS